MLRISCVLLVILSFSLIAKEQFAVVNVKSVNLINKRGVTMLELPRGSIVKLNSKVPGKSIYKVEIGQEVYSVKSSFLRSVTSLKSEEKRLKGDITELLGEIKDIEQQILIQSKKVNNYKKKIIELKKNTIEKSRTSLLSPQLRLLATGHGILSKEKNLVPDVGIEPTATRLKAARSTTELTRLFFGPPLTQALFCFLFFIV